MTENYSASSITSLTTAQHLRKKMNLTFGAESGDKDNPYSSMKRVAVSEIYSNSFDEVLGGHADNVSVSFYGDDSFEVVDNGRGIPIDAATDAHGIKKSGILLALGTIQSGGKFNQEGSGFSTGLNGVGASSVAVVSSRMDVSVYRGGKEYSVSFKEGEPGFFSGDGPDASFTPLKDMTYLDTKKDTRSAAEKKRYKTGTRIRVWLDDSAFSSPYSYDTDDVIERLKSTAFLIPSLYLEVYSEQTSVENPDTGKSEPYHQNFHFEDGIRALVDGMQSKERLTPIHHVKTNGSYVENNVPVIDKQTGETVNKDLEREIEVDVAFTYDTGYDSTVRTFVNTIHTHGDGVHLTAAQRAFSKAFNEKISTMRGVLKKGVDAPSVEDYMEGLSLVVSVGIHEPQFTSQSKEALSGREVQKAIQDALLKEFRSWISSSKNSDDVKAIVKKVSSAAENRQKAREQRETNRKKNALESANSLPTKLIDCERAGSEEAELYICEGDSALSSLKAARMSDLQALLPIRGKVINALKETPKRVLSNGEVQDITQALAASVGEDFRMENSRYGRIFIAADEDPDGYAISVLLVGLFWKMFRPIVEEGRLYKVETPLFEIKTKEGKKSRNIYTQNERDRDRELKKLESKGTKYTITRIKGLGECDADVLYETGMNPDTRVVTQITVDDIASAENALELAIGKNVSNRKEWLESIQFDAELADD